MVKDLCEIERPQAKYIEIMSTPSKAQLSYLDDCLDRAKAIEARKVEPTEDNYLKLTGDLTKAALWMKLVGNNEPEPIDSKLHKCIWNVWKIWKTTTNIKVTQVIFCDLSTPKPGRYSVYNYLKDFLVALGIPQSQVTFIHDWNKNKRNELYRLVDEGKIRIVIANTRKGGVGVNIHRRGLIAAHQIQCPWRERDVTQQEGRLVRQGNGNILGTTVNYPHQIKDYDVGFWRNLNTSRISLEVLFVVDSVTTGFPLRRFIVGNSPNPTRKHVY